MAPKHPAVPKAPLPTKVFFDPYNSSSTGHQRAENRLSGSTSWRDSRSYKLAHQFKDNSGRGGQTHLSDLVGAGSENFGKDGRKENGDWEKGAPGLRESGWQDIRGLMGGSKRKAVGDPDRNRDTSLKRGISDQSDLTSQQQPTASLKRHKSDHDTDESPSFASTSDSDTLPFSSAQPEPKPTSRPKSPIPSRRLHHISSQAYTIDDDIPSQPDAVQASNDDTSSPSSKPAPQIFAGLTVYLNGSTAPLVSDHRLKQLVAQHGGNMSIMLGRRTTTHVVIGEDCGGGLAHGKIQKEVTTVGGKGIKYVTAQWVLDSVEKGVRLSEARYAPKNLRSRIGGAGQGSVLGFLGVT
jgi:hypothetical protein